jgi:acyl carrier protein
MWISMSDSRQEKVMAVLQRLLSERSIREMPSPETNLLTFGLTSLDMINLVLSLEAEFDLVIPEGSISPKNLLSISAICQLLGKLMETAQASAC